MPTKNIVATRGLLSVSLLCVCGGCPLGQATNDLADGPASEATCPTVANVQNCPLTAPGSAAADGWCSDLFAPLFTHAGANVCYRGYGPNDGSQCCYTADGCLIGDDDLPAAGTPDVIGPAAGERCDGTCDWFREPLRLIGHWFIDVILAGLGYTPDGCACMP
ncbi:MAG: hypothetical protein KKB50_06835 [Planctomycetes bacterium]|nr:hypothetical protein [Planctomycetota bacterium]